MFHQIEVSVINLNSSKREFSLYFSDENSPSLIIKLIESIFREQTTEMLANDLKVQKHLTLLGLEFSQISFYFIMYEDFDPVVINQMRQKSWK